MKKATTLITTAGLALGLAFGGAVSAQAVTPIVPDATPYSVGASPKYKSVVLNLTVAGVKSGSPVTFTAARSNSTSAPVWGFSQIRADGLNAEWAAARATYEAAIPATLAAAGPPTAAMGTPAWYEQNTAYNARLAPLMAALKAPYDAARNAAIAANNTLLTQGTVSVNAVGGVANPQGLATSSTGAEGAVAVTTIVVTAVGKPTVTLTYNGVSGWSVPASSAYVFNPATETLRYK